MLDSLGLIKEVSIRLAETFFTPYFTTKMSETSVFLMRNGGGDRGGVGRTPKATTARLPKNSSKLFDDARVPGSGSRAPGSKLAQVQDRPGDFQRGHLETLYII